ncbi:MAG TPA: type II secretion system secretin GspD [Candidatus Hydrogenedens sp.]|nr:type II secretion system secretin GspD [Candidatus Hydrogenedens sp.]
MRIEGKYFFKIVNQVGAAFSWTSRVGCLFLLLTCATIFISYGQDEEQISPEVPPSENVESPQIIEAPSVPESPPQMPGMMRPPTPMPEPVRPPGSPRAIPSFPTVRRGNQPPIPPGPRTPASTGGNTEEKPQIGIAAEEGPKTGETPSEPISFDFHDAPLYDVIAAISRLTGRNFDVDPNIGATTVTVITHDKIPPEMAYQVLESILSSRGFSMLETLDGKLIKIIATPDAVQSDKTPLIKGTEKLPEGYDKFATHILTLKYADASEVSTALQVLGSKSCRISAYAPTNTLIITDTADGLRRIFSFMQEIDVEGNETEMEIFMLEYTRAEALSQQIEQVLSDTKATGTGGRAPGAPMSPQPVIRPTSRSVPGAPSMQIIGSRQEVLRMVPDTRLNALIVVATEGMMEKVRDLIKRLDCPTPYEANNLHIYELLNADAEQVEQALQPLIGGSGSARRTTGTAGTTGTRSTASVGGGMASAAVSSGPEEVQPFEQRVQITRYDQTNSLLVVASPQDYKVLEAFIARLDVPQRQVLVDGVVMDVNLTNDFGVKVDAASVSGNSGFGVTSTSNILQVVGSLQNTADAANSIVNPSRLNLMMGVLGMGSGGGLTTGIYDDIVIPISKTQRLRIPFVPLLLQAIETVSDLEVLSQPSLVTVDNEEASIVVGQEVPFISSTASPQRTSTGDVVSDYGWGGYTRVERHEVGIKLTVTPQISEGDNVLMKIEIEVSSVAGASQSVGSVDILGPTTNKSLFKNQVLVKDGSTAVLAGLIRDTADRNRTQVPVMGDIPLLGFLFRSKSVKREKRNMVVLVTPHIVKESSDMERVTQYKVTEYQDINIQELFKTGFFKKVKAKSDMRKNYRPTLDRTEALTGQVEQEKFNRGTIYRK